MNFADNRRKEVKLALDNTITVINNDPVNNTHNDCYIKDNVLYFTRAGILKFPEGQTVYGCVEYGVKAGFVDIVSKVKNKRLYSYNPQE